MKFILAPNIFRISIIILSVCTIIIFLQNILVPAYFTNFKSTPIEFTTFLNDCGDRERVLLAQSLNYLPKIDNNAYGKLSVKSWVGSVELQLREKSFYAKNAEEIKAGKEILPTTYNHIPPELTLAAIDQGYLDKNLISVERIKKGLLWSASHWFTYLFKNDDFANIVDWAAKKRGISDVEKKSTRELIRLVSEDLAKKRFEQIWSKLSDKQRVELLTKIDKEQILSTNEKMGIATGSSAAAIATLSGTMAASGFAFYTTLTSAIYTIAALINVTLPFTTYTTATATAATMGGPIGWGIATIMIGVTPFLFGWADLDTTSQFIATVYTILEG